MTETERLRKLLNEHGVKWKDASTGHIKWTFWGDNCWFTEYEDGKTGWGISGPDTPEQAVKVTLGYGTCHIEDRNGDWYCTQCGEIVGTCDPASELYIDGNVIDLWKYCPSCGAKVVS